MEVVVQITCPFNYTLFLKKINYTFLPMYNSVIPHISLPLPMCILPIYPSKFLFLCCPLLFFLLH